MVRGFPYSRRMEAVICILFGLVVALGLVLPSVAMARPEFLSRAPANLSSRGCNLCHSQVPSLNDFGQAFKQNSFSFAGLTDQGGRSETPVATGGKGAVAGAATQGDKGLQVKLMLPAEVVRGEKTGLKAWVTAGGEPVDGEQVRFYEETDLFIGGRMYLGEATTNAEGMAEIDYWPMATEGEVKLVAQVAAGADIPAAEGAATFPLVAAGPLVEPVARLEVPFLGGWLVFVLVGAVWAIYLYSVYSALQIRRLGREAVEEKVAQARQERRYASI
ncbi:MAG: hypothetical protein D9V47_00370 [Clostridia bacterium]|nr:MAG: hypothetical protein D9V47_00370 [Clostridia bacterium]